MKREPNGSLFYYGNVTKTAIRNVVFITNRGENEFFVLSFYIINCVYIKRKFKRNGDGIVF